MNFDLKPGLYIIPTPIGNLKDITLRALDTLKACHAVFCEDTRVTSKLLNAYGIEKTLRVFQEHNEKKAAAKILERVQRGESIGLVSDAGTPLINDPGYKLIGFLRENNVYVTVLPGACAVISALCLSGAPTDRFSFAGFFESNRAKTFTETPGSLIFYESPKRLLKTLEKLEAIFPRREISVIREISKIYEETVSGSLREVIDNFEKRGAIKGEMVIVVWPTQNDSKKSFADLKDEIQTLLKERSVKDVSLIIHEKYRIGKTEAYRMALAHKAALTVPE